MDFGVGREPLLLSVACACRIGLIEIRSAFAKCVRACASVFMWASVVISCNSYTPTHTNHLSAPMGWGVDVRKSIMHPCGRLMGGFSRPFKCPKRRPPKRHTHTHTHGSSMPFVCRARESAHLHPSSRRTEIHRQQQTYPKNTRGPGQSARTSEIHYPANKLLLFKICINVRAKYAEGLRWCCCLRVSALSVYTCACVCVFVKLSRSARNAGAYCCRQQKAWLPRSTINRRAIIEMSVDSRKSPATEYGVDILLLLLLLGHTSLL